MASLFEDLESVQQGFDVLAAEFKKKTDEFWQGPSLWDQIQAFIHAVDWSERWLIALLSAHAILLVVVLLTRQRQNLQFALFVLCCAGVYMSENINAWAAHHWQQFATQNYFDSSGLFASVVFSGPLLLISSLLVIQMMVSVVQSMVKWKRAELKHRARRAGAQAAKKQE